MAYELKPGQGSIFKNDKTNDNAPDYKGRFVSPAGEPFEISLWVKESKEGKKYFSASVQEPYKKDDAPSQSSPSRQEPADDLPF